ncbi:MAG: glycerol-3-phosphate dehydrogenase [Candidatus Omnitrophica bacterium]|nr:glycerol-3-phosphate dehydrogenase [Candidatus Omnitrophota bacterium]
MKRDTTQFPNIPYDLLVIGGGINGAAVANMAAQNKLRVALLEKGDFASGTSSKSTKLIHGGLRYLEHFDFGLVRESLHERTAQMRIAPHLVKPLGFIIPVYKKDPRPLWMMKLGVSIYDLLSGKDIIHPFKPLTAEEVIHFIPGIKRDGLTGGLIYWDAQMDDARLVLENILQADFNGAHMANYVEVRMILKENGKAVGVTAKDLLTGATFDVRAKQIVCAVGPWTNFFQRKERSDSPARVRTTKGVHIVYQGQFCRHAVFIQSRSDKRIFFMVPWYGNTMIGTTDTDYEQNPDDVKVEAEDIQYLFQEAGRVFPDETFVDEKIISTFAGLRPLVHKDDAAPEKVSRKHVINRSFSGMQYIMGGKYTTYRVIARESLMQLTLRKPGELNTSLTVYGGGEPALTLEQICEKYGVSDDVAQMLVQTYGSRVEDVLRLTEGDAALRERLDPAFPYIKAQLKYAVSVEMACSADDIIWRRLPLAYQGLDTPEIRSTIEDQFLPV